MSTKFNKDIHNYKLQIQEQCNLYRLNFQEFFELIEVIKLKHQINEEDVKQSEKILTQMNNGDIRVIFCGQVKSGKTKCVMEFLCGAIELPSKDTPATKYFARIFYSEKPVLYSEGSDGKKDYYDFDGKSVSENLIENRNNAVVDDDELDIIFHIGVTDRFLKDFVIVIDSPGLNETKRLDEVFKTNLRKLNPQIVIYIFNYGPGFVDSDVIYHSTVISTLRKDLRQIFLFNKFDQAFSPSKRFPSDDESDNDFDPGEYSSEEDDDNDADNFEDLYNKQFEIHKKSLSISELCITCPCLIGYSGKYTGLHRCKKEPSLKQFRSKHLELLNNLRCSIRSIDTDALENILKYSKQFLFSQFQNIFKQISQSNNTSKHSVLSTCYRDRVLEKFASSHDKILTIDIKLKEQINFDGPINQIIKNQERIRTTHPNMKFVDVMNSLTKFFIDRYVNFFSNIILATLEDVSFDKLNDELRLSGLDNCFSHTSCILQYEVEDIESVIKSYFEKEEERVVSNFTKKEQQKLLTTEATTFYIKNQYKYQKELVGTHVENFIKTVVESERTKLEMAIEAKKNEIISDLKASQEEIKVMIEDSLFFLRKYLKFSNNYVLELSKSDFTIKEKREFYNDLINTTTEDDIDLNRVAVSLNIVYKKEHVDFDDISYYKCGLIKYFLRNQYISDCTCKTILFFNENKQSLSFIVDLEDRKPLREFLNDDVKDTEKIKIIAKLIRHLLCLYDLSLPLENFCPDMVFCKNTPEGVELKIVESALKFDEWRYTLFSGKVSLLNIHKYPFHNADATPSMFYGLAWTILIILYGRCEDLFPGKINEKIIEKEIAKKIPTFATNKILVGCSKIIKFGLKTEIKFEALNDIVSLLNDMIKD